MSIKYQYYQAKNTTVLQQVMFSQCILIIKMFSSRTSKIWTAKGLFFIKEINTI